eukprot:2749317-Amphidinium_carterae.2
MYERVMEDINRDLHTVWHLIAIVDKTRSYQLLKVYRLQVTDMVVLLPRSGFKSELLGLPDEMLCCFLVLPEWVFDVGGSCRRTSIMLPLC